MKLAAVAIAMDRRQPELLENIGKRVEEEAKSAFGQDNWEPGAPFETPWADLAEPTQDFKERHGWTGRVSQWDTLLRSGRTRDTIRHAVLGDNKVVVGSNSPIMQMLELGTTRMPPRSVLGGAMNRMHRWAAGELGAGMVSQLVGRQVLSGAMTIRRR